MDIVLIGVLGYVAVQLLVGLAVSRHIATESDYLLAGRRLGYGLATFSLFATWFGAETCIGAAGATYTDGLSGNRADPFGFALCLFFMGAVLSTRLCRLNLTTLADLFRIRFSPAVEKLAVFALVPSSVLWAAAQIRAFGQVLAASSSFSVELCIAISALVVVAYTVSGGLLADAMTDVVQGIALIVGLVVLAVAIGDASGGWSAAAAAVGKGRLSLWVEGESFLTTLNVWAVPICGSVVTQELVARVIASRTPVIARRSSFIAGAGYLLVGLIPVGLGLLGAQMLPGLEDPEQVLPLLARRHLSTFLYVLFAGALVSAILSTVDSALLAASSLCSHNLVIPLFPGLSERGKLRVSRAGVAAFGALAYGIALHAEGIYDLVVESSSFGTAGVFVVVMFGLFSRFGGPRAALGALLTGIFVWVGAHYGAGLDYAFVAALAAAAAAYAALGLFEKKGRGSLPALSSEA